MMYELALFNVVELKKERKRMTPTIVAKRIGTNATTLRKALKVLGMSDEFMYSKELDTDDIANKGGRAWIKV